MTVLALSQADMKRLERLANEAGRTPRALLKLVLRDGFDETGRTIKAMRARMNSGTTVEHADAMRRLDMLLSSATRADMAACAA